MAKKPNIILRLGNVPLLEICPINGKHQVIEQNVPVKTQKVSIPFTHTSNAIRCVPLSARVPLHGLTDRVQNQ